MRKRKMGIIGLGLSLLLVGCSFPGKESGTTTPPPPAVTESAPANVQGTTDQRKSTEKQATVKENAEHTFTIASHSVVKDRSGSDVLVIEYAWTNNSGKETSFMVACQDRVYQNGVECPSYAVMIDEVDSQQQMVDIKPGTTFNLKVGYVLQDNTNATVEVTDFLGQDYYLQQTIDLGGGEGKNSGAPTASSETTIKISEVFLSKDYKGKDVLVVKYEYTNGDDKAHAFSTTFDDKVYQNGVECSSLAVFCDDVDSNTGLASVKPGVTLIVEEGYLLNDKSDVEIEVKELFGDKVYLSEKRSIQ